MNSELGRENKIFASTNTNDTSIEMRVALRFILLIRIIFIFISSVPHKHKMNARTLDPLHWPVTVPVTICRHFLATWTFLPILNVHPNGIVTMQMQIVHSPHRLRHYYQREKNNEKKNNLVDGRWQLQGLSLPTTKQTTKNRQRCVCVCVWCVI